MSDGPSQQVDIPTSRFTYDSDTLPGAGLDGIGRIPVAEATVRHPLARCARNPVLPA
jgi:hypothetical protein